MALNGKIIVFTGALTISRKEAGNLAEKAGATVGNGVTAKTNILVAGPDAIDTKQKRKELKYGRSQVLRWL